MTTLVADAGDRFPRRAEFFATKLRLLESLYDLGPGSIDGADGPDQRLKKFPRGGPWRGAAVLSLCAERLIEETGDWHRSKRRFRHGGENRVWVLVDPIRAAQSIQRLRRYLGLKLRLDLMILPDLLSG